MKNNLMLKQLNLNPLSVAKYFWKKEGIDDYALIQDFLYLTYLEVLKKEGQVLFKEKFQAWEECPVLESVHQHMKYHFEKHGTMDCLFEQVEDLGDKEIKPYLTKTYRDYQNAKKKGKETIADADLSKLFGIEMDQGILSPAVKEKSKIKKKRKRITA